MQKDKGKCTDKDKYRVLQRLHVCYIFEKQGVKHFKYDIDYNLVLKNGVQKNDWTLRQYVNVM